MSHRLQRIIALTLCTAAIAGTGCGSSASNNATGQSPQTAQSAGEELPTAMNAKEAKKFLAENPETLLLDVRTPPEWEGELAAMEGAMLVPLSELPNRLEELEEWKTKPILSVCRSGRRSETARRMLAKAGFEKVINLSGGMIDWKKAGYSE